jgi:hypothetical protein
MSHVCATTSLFTKRGVRIRALVAAVALLLAAGPAARTQEPVTRAALGVSWAAEDELRALFKDASTVKGFLNEIANGGDLAVPDMIGDVEEFRIVDLDRDGWLELVALVSGTGRNLSTNLEVVFHRPSRAQPPDRLATEFEGFVMRELSGFDVGDLNAVLRDLDKDGAYEIVMPQLLGPYEGAARPSATMPEIYAWNGADYAKVSAKFPKFYRDEVLPRLERELQNLKGLPEANTNAGKAELRARREKCLREIAEARRRVPQR